MLNTNVTPFKKPNNVKSSYYYTEKANGPMLDKVFSMRYRSYSGAGHIDTCQSGKFMDECDEQTNASSYLLYKRPEGAIASLRLCVYDPQKELIVPAMGIFEDEIKKEVGLDKRFVEVNRFVVEPEHQRRGGVRARFKLFERVVDSALEWETSSIIIAVRPEHVEFYKMLLLRPISTPKTYHHVKFKTVLMVCTDILEARRFIKSRLYGNRDQPASYHRAN